ETLRYEIRVERPQMIEYFFEVLYSRCAQSFASRKFSTRKRVGNNVLGPSS
ncbi:hypothetical protein F441_22378, partial [Phytophthora nicotianae CJ01A1]